MPELGRRAGLVLGGTKSPMAVAAINKSQRSGSEAGSCFLQAESGVPLALFYFIVFLTLAITFCYGLQLTSVIVSNIMAVRLPWFALIARLTDDEK